MMQQYLEIKSQYKDAILFYRLGDFYEMFFDDAKTASRELELTLTGRDCGEAERAPMCGIPYHSADAYIGKLVSKGYKVVICEQLEDPSKTKTIVKRDVVRIVTPGTVIDSAQLQEDKNNYLCAIYITDKGIGISYADISTGELSATVLSGSDCMGKLANELATYSPREVLVNVSLESFRPLKRVLKQRMGAMISDMQEDRFEYSRAFAAASKRFGSGEINSSADKHIVCAVGALLGYIDETQMAELSNITKLNINSEGQYVEIDASTRRNLELCETMRSKEKKGTLLWVLDKTKTSMGARMLRRWIELPLVNQHNIGRRQRAVAELSENFIIREEISEQLRKVLDLDRLMTKLIYGTAGARDLKAISATVSVIPEIKELLENSSSEELADICLHMDSLSDIRMLIDSAITDDPPFSIREGGFIRAGYNERVDELNEILTNGKGYIEEIAEKERNATGIKNLKISYNRVFGYYIEVTKSNIGDVPDNYIRKQTLTNCERYITEELKEKEALILGASEKLNALEYEIFTEIREKISSQIQRVQESAELLAKLDVYLSLAEVAVKNGYVCPEIEYGDAIHIKDGRHPVVEQFSGDGYFVPNDTLLDTTHNRLALITGPNMAGKSTYMRQVALITIMAQIGSFVPASSARISIVDKIFTRVGASDDLASGQSTFMLEMNEVAYILKNATKRSLIIYDEIGRGTSTFDGMSIARAVAEYTSSKIGAKTLFATHYHELTDMDKEFPEVVNYNIAAKKKGDDIIFLRKIVKGATDDSYGIEVAKLAGVPNEIIRRAKEILRTLDENGISLPEKRKSIHEDDNNISFDDFKAKDVRQKLIDTDVNILTPLEALNLIYELKKLAD